MARRVAFLIGNRTFRPDANLPPLNGPLNDIAALSKILGDPTRGAFEVHEFPDASSGAIKSAIEEQLTTAERGDLVLVHYAGHGKLDRVGNLCLATADTRANSLLSTSIPARHLRDLAANSDCDAVVLLLDCCYSGAAAGDTRGDVESQLRSLQDASGFYILTASSEIQTAGESEEERDGVVMGRFTAAIVDGLETGSADRDRDGQISLYDLVRHVKTVVKHQTPQFLAARASGDPLIARSPSTAAPLLDAGALADLASDNWRHRLGAVAYLAGVLKGKDGAAAAAARDLLQRRLNEERDVEVRQRVEEALTAASPTSPVPKAPGIKAPETTDMDAERTSLSGLPQESPKPSVAPLHASAKEQVRAAVVAPGAAAGAANQRRYKLWGAAMLGLVIVGFVGWQIHLRTSQSELAIALSPPNSASPLVKDSPPLLNPAKDASPPLNAANPMNATKNAPPPVEQRSKLDPPSPPSKGGSLVAPNATQLVAPQQSFLVGRYVFNACGSITDTTTRLEWYLASDEGVSWQGASRWASALQACGGGWSLPAEQQAATLFDPAKMEVDPVFAGTGSWIWLRGGSAQGQSPAYNLSLNQAVKFSSDGTKYPTRAFAVREARSQ
jgi:uncharacterized caspase-like protein